jgi:hypothetical protein
MEHFQRHLATAAFKLAGGVDLSSSVSSSKPVKQHPVSQVFVTKITKAFLDALYAFLDGLILLASDESPIFTGKMLLKQEETFGPNRLDLLDLSDGVSPASDCGKITLTSSDICVPFPCFLTFPCFFSRTVGHPHAASDVKL